MTALPLTSPTLQSFAIDVPHSEVNFQVRHLMSRVRGEFTRFDGTFTLDRADLERSTATFRIDAASLNTRLADRDAHLRSADFFDVENHPEISFRSAAIRAVGERRFEVTGTLSMRGIARPVVLDVELLGFLVDPSGQEKVGFRVTTTINRKDFGMVWNVALDNGGILLGDEVSIEIHLELGRTD